MRKKELKLVITFHTTADAMAMEQYCRGQNLPGRLIPVPKEITASCGLAWCAPLEYKDYFKTKMYEAHLQAEGAYACTV